MTITNRLREIAAQRGYSLIELARRSGVSASVVYTCAKGAVPGPSVRGRLSKALQVEPSALWDVDPTEGAPHV